jgi:peptidoglycan hydrolase CwlO-like protein
MRSRITSIVTLVAGLIAFSAMHAVSAAAAQSADCSQGSAEEKVTCLNQKIVDLEAQVAQLTKETLKWNDRITLLNEDMRIYPRCLDNAGPNAPDIALVLAAACSKTPAQAWMIRKPYQ